MPQSDNMAAVGIRVNPIGVCLTGAAVLLAVVYLFGLPAMFVSEPKIKMKELLSVSIDLARRGGEAVKKVRAEGNMGESVKGETKEGAKEMLTNADLNSHRAIVYGFKKAFPELYVVSEEHETKPVDLATISEPSKTLKEVQDIDSNQEIPYSDIRVWIDPLDATQEYTEKLDEYVTTLVCVAVRGQPIIGVIQHVFTGETEWGYAGYGHSANLDGELTDKKESDPYKIIVSRSHAGEVAGVAKAALGENTDIIPAGGAGYKTSEVIRGKADAYVHVTYIKKWDICAGNAIIVSKGGRMTTIEGKNIDYSSGDPGNNYGLLATLNNHDSILKKLKPGFEEMKKKEKPRQ